MASKNIGIREEVYERLKAHKRGDESFSEAIDRILTDLDTDWRTHVGFLAGPDADALEAEVADGLDQVDESVADLGREIDDALEEDS